MPQKQTESTTPKRAHRAWSLYIGSVAGIPIYLHFTFLLLLVFVGFMQLRWGHAVFGGLALIVAVFASVALHELGHALVARSYGIKTDDIVLYPIGGVARLRSMGEKTQEFWIAVAGPSVNVAIATVIGLYLYFSGGFTPIRPGDMESTFIGPNFLQQLMLINIILVLFNLIPAFPMDGGRVLRSLLTLAMNKERATSIAAGIGQALAIVFVLVGLIYGHVFLMFIGIFVFIAAGQESMATKSQALMSGKLVRDAMITRFEVLNHGDTLGRAADLLLATSQQDFPVMNGSEVLGVLGRKELLQGLASLGRDNYVAEAMTREFPRISPSDPLESAFDRMRTADGLPVLVLDGDRLIGYVNNENLMEYLTIQQMGRP